MHCDMLKIQDGGAIVEKVNCASHVDILGYKLMFRALYKTVLFSEFIYIALKHSLELY